MNKEKISIVMSEYNTNINYLEKSIESILNQSLKDFEFIIVDDCTSSDNKKYLETISKNDQRIKLISNEKNLGLAASLNKGISKSNGDYIFRMDSDDISFPNRIEKQLEIIKNKDILVTNRVQYIDEDDNILGEMRKLPFNNFSRNILLKYFFRNGVVHPTIAGKKKIFQEFKYNESIRYAQDYDLWLRIIKKYKIYFDDEILLKYRVINNSINLEKMKLQYKTYENVSKKYIKNNIFKKVTFYFSKRKYLNSLKIKTNKDKYYFTN